MAHLSSVSLPMYKKLAAARREVGQSAPYLMPAVLSLVPRACPGLGTLAVTKRLLLLFDPELVARLTHKKLATMLIHEVGHVMREHADRAERHSIQSHEDRTLWNYAGDITINDDIGHMRDVEWPQVKDFFPKGDDPDGRKPDDKCAITHESFGFESGLPTETYYRLLKEQQKESQQGNGQSPIKQGNTIMAGACGGAAGNPGEDEPADGQDPMERSGADVQTIRKRVAGEIKKAAEQGRGSVPGGWSRWADDFLKPPEVRWDEKFRRAFRRCYQWVAGQQLARFGKASRRQAGAGFGVGRAIIPKMESPKPRIGFIVDTSGSMGSDELATAASECYAILKTVKADIQFLANDADNEGIFTIRDVRQLKEVFKGGGGTDFRPALDTLSAQSPRKRPEIVVFVTDGCGPAPAVAPPYHLIWVLVGRHAEIPWKCPDSDRGGWNDKQGKVDYGEFIWVGEACANKNAA